MAGWASRCTLCQVPASWQITLAARTDNRLFFRLQTRSSGLFFSPQLILHFLPWQPWSIDLQAFKLTAKRICLRTVHKACVKINWIFKGASGWGQCQRKDKLTVWIGNEAKRFYLHILFSPGLYPQWVVIWAGNPGRDSQWGWWSPWRGDMEIGARIGAITPD